MEVIYDTTIFAFRITSVMQNGWNDGTECQYFLSLSLNKLPSMIYESTPMSLVAISESRLNAPFWQSIEHGLSFVFGVWQYLIGSKRSTEYQKLPRSYFKVIILWKQTVMYLSIVCFYGPWCNITNGIDLLLDYFSVVNIAFYYDWVYSGLPYVI